METTMNTMNPDRTATRAGTEQSSAPSRLEDATPERRREDVVHRGEFRLLLWMGAFALTAVLGGMTFLYTVIMDLRVAIVEEHVELRVTMAEEHAQLRTDMGVQIAQLRTDMEAQIEGLRSDMEAQIEGLRSDMQAQIEGLRSDMQAQIEGLRSDMQAEHMAIRREISSLREGIVRIETHLGIGSVAS